VKRIRWEAVCKLFGKEIEERKGRKTSSSGISTGYGAAGGGRKFQALHPAA